MSVTPIDCYGSSVDEFMQNARRVIGQGLLGKTTCEPTYDCKLDAQNKITNAKLSLEITSKTAHWAGPGFRDAKHTKRAPQPDTANRNAIMSVEALNKQHEQHHIDGYQKVFDKQKSTFEKKMIGQTIKEAQETTLAELNDALKAACEELHTTEGLISVIQQGGAFQVVVQPEGPGGCG
jgi:hypothetical protein